MNTGYPLDLTQATSDIQNNEMSRFWCVQMRDFRQVVLEGEIQNIDYEVGDALDIYPCNNADEVKTFLEAMHLEPGSVVCSFARVVFWLRWHCLSSQK